MLILIERGGIGTDVAKGIVVIERLILTAHLARHDLVPLYHQRRRVVVDHDAFADSCGVRLTYLGRHEGLFVALVQLSLK